MNHDPKTMPIAETRIDWRNPRPSPRGATAAAASADEPRASFRAPLRLLRMLGEPRALSLADQAVVSGTSFLTTVLIGRFTLPSELGIYSLAASLLISLLCIQESLVTLPYTIQRHRPLGTPTEHAGNCLTLSAMLALTAFVILGIAALSISAFRFDDVILAAAWALAVVAPFALLRDLRRQFAFARLDVSEALIVDISVAIIQLGSLGWLAWMGWMSATTALAAIGLACGLAGSAGLLFGRFNFQLRVDLIPRTVRQCWSLGQWLFAHQLVTLMQGQVIYWVVAWTSDISSTGIYAACMSVALLANPFILGLSNTLCAKAALAFKEGGIARLRRESVKDALLLGSAMAVFCAVIALKGGDVMLLLYRSPEYAGHGQTVLVLTLAQLCFAVGMPATNALLNIEGSRLNFWIAFVSAIIMVVLIYPLAIHWGVLGAAYGLLIGNIARATARWAGFLIIARRPTHATTSPSEIADVTQVLQQFRRRADVDDLTITDIDEASRGRVFLVKPPADERNESTADELVVKLYQPVPLSGGEVAGQHFRALARLNAALNGRTIEGWKTHTPQPLHMCQSPPALVMTMAPGRKLADCLETGDEAAGDALAVASHAIVAVMEEYWSTGDCCGLTLQDVLCDLADQEISFVGLGVPEVMSSADVVERHNPIVRDLAYMVFDAAATTSISIGRTSIRLRKQIVLDNVLRIFLRRMESARQREQWLADIDDCAHLYIRALVPPAGGGFGHALDRTCYRVTRRIAARHLEAMLLRIMTEFSLEERSPILNRARAGGLAAANLRCTASQR